MFTYNLGSFYVGAMISGTDVKVNNTGTDIFDGLGTGYGGAFGMEFSFAKVGKFLFELRSVSTSTFKHDSSSKVELGARTDINLMGKIPLTRRMVSLDIGFKSSSYSLSVGGTSTEETVYTTWGGLSFNFNP